MTTVTATAPNVDQLLDARLAQAQGVLDHRFATMDGSLDLQQWNDVIDMKEDVVNAAFAQQQHFIIQHHLAKTILSTT